MYTIPIRLLLILLLLVLGGCKQLFETASDVQARQALKDLIAVQQDYHKKKNTYARNLIEIKEAGLNLNYHAGIVYLEIEQANASSWRAVALPAESPTARVFAFDSQKGGYYEMDEEEVGSYVLGALHYIREKQRGKELLSAVAFATIIGFTLFGMRTWMRNRVPGSGWLAWPFLVSIPPLAFSALTLIYMENEVVLSDTLQTFLVGGCVLAVVCMGITWKGFSKVPKGEALTSLSALAVCTVLIGLLNILVATHTFLNFSENPDPFEKYLKPEGQSPRVGFGSR